MSSKQGWIDAADAARLLRVSRATLYAYVSRGFVRSQSTAGPSRERRYSRDDVERLRRRTEERRDPEKAAARALQWGVPVLESSITLIDGDRFYYRGHDAVALSRGRSVGDVASLIWTGAFDLAPSRAEGARPAVALAKADSSGTADLPFVARAQTSLAAAATHDASAFDLRAQGVAITGWRILTLLTLTATQSHAPGQAPDQALARAWRANARGVDLLRSALILCADHELNVSSFTARCVASAGANPYAVVIAGLSALQGTRHGGAGVRVEALLASMRRVPRLGSAIAERLRRGEPIDGFGHPLYPHGDPRAAAILDLLRERYQRSPELAFVLDFAATSTAAVREHPNLDFALAALARVLRLPAGSPLTLLAIGRSIGWIGHAIEQYATGQLIRPRARYVGIIPSRAAQPPR